MVAISLYRGNLHRVPDVPRRWLMPTPQISLKSFKSLLRRRSLALSRLRPGTSAAIAVIDSNPSEEAAKLDIGCSNASVPPHSDPSKGPDAQELNATCGGAKDGVKDEVQDLSRSDGRGCATKPVEESALANRLKRAVLNSTEAVRDEDAGAPANPDTETSNKGDASNDREKRIKEVEEKLQVLNAKKHNLVQVLKQILNAEEELKRRNSRQAMASRPSVPLQVDVMNDSGSMSRHVTPRMGSEGNLGVDMEGGEADDVSNQNMHSRHLLRMSSVSPSSESPLRRPAYFQHSGVPHPTRPTLGASPSRFAPTGNLGHPANLPAVTVSGTSYIASSPSPAASGGTSVFKDARLPSPWN